MLLGLLFVSMAANALAFYNTQTGRWLSRDPIGERGGKNLHAIAANDCIENYDPLGLQGIPPINPNNPPPWLEPDPQYIKTGSDGRTEAVKNRDTVRADVRNLVDNMLASREKGCTSGKAVERKHFKPASATSYAFMYSTGYFLLGQVSVDLNGSGLYEVDCCNNKFLKWKIMIGGSFDDKFDELIPLPGPKKGTGSLPIEFVGSWVEFYSGSE